MHTDSNLVVAHSVADQARRLGLVVGETIFGRDEHGEYWHEAELTLLWAGQEACVWRERSRCSSSPAWQDMGEVTDWSLDDRAWCRLLSSQATVQDKVVYSGVAQAKEPSSDVGEILQFMADEDAFLHRTRADAGRPVYQLMSQDEDEVFVVLSGDDRFFPTPIAAVQAARCLVAKTAEGSAA